MQLSKSTYRHSTLYRHFREIGATEFQAIIRFYERHEVAIENLEANERFDLLIIYTDALFQTNKYQNFLLAADQAIELSIFFNIKSHRGVDVYHDLLFKKAAAHYHLHEDNKTEYVLRELIKMNPHDKLSLLFLRKCRRRIKPLYLMNARAISIFLFLLTAAIIFIEILIVRPIYSNLIDIVEAARICTFLLGILFLAGSDLIHLASINKEVRKFVNKEKEKKKKTFAIKARDKVHQTEPKH